MKKYEADFDDTNLVEEYDAREEPGNNRTDRNGSKDVAIHEEIEDSGREESGGERRCTEGSVERTASNGRCENIVRCE